jgi:hypothetical protein
VIHNPTAAQWFSHFLLKAFVNTDAGFTILAPRPQRKRSLVASPAPSGKSSKRAANGTIIPQHNSAAQLASQIQLFYQTQERIRMEAKKNRRPAVISFRLDPGS